VAGLPDRRFPDVVFQEPVCAIGCDRFVLAPSDARFFSLDVRKQFKRKSTHRLFGTQGGMI
jgi:hypothetical protein